MDANGINASKMEVAKQPGLAILCALRIFSLLSRTSRKRIGDCRMPVVAEIASKIDDFARFAMGFSCRKCAKCRALSKENHIGMPNFIGKAEIGSPNKSR